MCVCVCVCCVVSTQRTYLSIYLPPTNLPFSIFHLWHFQFTLLSTNSRTTTASSPLKVRTIRGCTPTVFTILQIFLTPIHFLPNNNSIVPTFFPRHPNISLRLHLPLSSSSQIAPTPSVSFFDSHPQRTTQKFNDFQFHPSRNLLTQRLFTQQRSQFLYFGPTCSQSALSSSIYPFLYSTVPPSPKLCRLHVPTVARSTELLKPIIYVPLAFA